MLHWGCAASKERLALVKRKRRVIMYVGGMGEGEGRSAGVCARASLTRQFQNLTAPCGGSNGFRFAKV
jgi:hypothetical protein